MNKRSQHQKKKKIKNNTKPRNPNSIKEKLDVRNNATTLLNRREMVHNGFDRGIFSSPNQPVVGKLEK